MLIEKVKLGSVALARFRRLRKKKRWLVSCNYLFFFPAPKNKYFLNANKNTTSTSNELKQ